MRVALLGDIALYGKFSANKNESIKKYFKDVSELLSDFDLVIGNLETPFSTDKQTYGAKSAYISSDIENIDILKYLNIHIVNLANNHIFDYGVESYQLTKDILRENKIKYFGTEGSEEFIEFETNKIALSGFCCYSTNPLKLVNDNTIGANELNVEKVSELIRRNNNNGYYNIVSLHCGQEHVNYPNYDNILLARYLSKICPFTYYGHHPHVAQGVEEVNNSIIAYSLGNFCFDDIYIKNENVPFVKLSENNKSSFILELILECNEVKEVKIIPIYMDEESMIIGKGTTKENIDEYTKAIHEMNKEEYTAMRQAIINKYINSRKKRRDFRWYVKRLNFRYMLLFISGHINARKYRRNVVNHISQK